MLGGPALALASMGMRLACQVVLLVLEGHHIFQLVEGIVVSEDADTMGVPCADG